MIDPTIPRHALFGAIAWFLGSVSLFVVLAVSNAAGSILSEVAFEENRGQLPTEIRFATRAAGFGVVAYAGGPAIRARIDGEIVEFRLRFDGGDGTVEPEGEEVLAGRLHYFRGATAADWQTNIVRYGRIRYANVYPGIDAVLHDRDGEVELDFEVAPSANPETIAISFEGVDRVEIEPTGRLSLIEGEKRFELSTPEIYQRELNGEREPIRLNVPGRYRVDAKGRVEFELARYDKASELVIDPVFLGFSTRIGGSGTDRVGDLATDSAGNLYLTGSTSSTDFAGLTAAPVGEDVFVAKLDPTGQNLVYVAFFGGDGMDAAWAIEADSAGNAHVAGSTASSTFPTLGGYDSTPNNTDAFYLKLDPNGALLYGTVYGEAAADGEFNGGLGIHEPSGRVYIGSRTDSTNIPTLNPFATLCPNAPCSFVVGFDPSLTGAASRVYATYVTDPAGVSPNEDGGILDLDVDSSENIYAFGFVNPNSDIVAAGQGFLNATGDVNNNDHFLVKLDPSLVGSAQRTYSTFIGGTGDESERGRIVALDSGVVYVGSKTDSTAATFPVLNALQPTNAGGEDTYVVKVDSTLVGAASQLWTTFLGSAFNEEINAVAVDAAENVWVAATVSANASGSFPQVLPLPGSPASGIDDDAVVAQISSDGSTLLFSSSIAAGRAPQEQGIAVQPSGRVVVAGSRADALFPLRGGLPLFDTGGKEIALVGLDPAADLGLVLEISETSDPAVSGETFGFQYLVKNRGVGDAANAIMTTDFPAGLSASLTSANCSFPGSSATCDLFEDIPRGGDAPIYFLASSAVDGSYAVNASVTSDLADPSPGDDSDSDSVLTNATGSFPASLVLADFDAVAASSDIGGFALDTAKGVLATPNGTFGEVLNMMSNNGALPFQVEELLGQGEIAFGFVDNGNWTPTSGDGSDLFGRDFNAAADRVFAIVDSKGRVELRTARSFNEGRVVATGFVPLGRPGLLSMTLSPTNAEVLFDGFVVASGDPFTTDSRDADPLEVGDDFVISVGFGTEDRGTAIINVPEPGAPLMLIAGMLGLQGLCRRRSSNLRTSEAAPAAS